MIEYHCRYDELVDPGELIPNPKNPNLHPQEQIESLCRFIRVSGWRQVVTVSSRSGYVVSGHARLIAAKAIGCKVPVVSQGFESEADEIAFLLADNRLAELAITDDVIFQSNLEFLTGDGFNVEDFGLDIEIGKSNDENYGDIVEIPEIEITEKQSLKKITMFVEDTLYKEVVGKLKNICSEYDVGLVRIVT